MQAPPPKGQRAEYDALCDILRVATPPLEHFDQVIDWIVRYGPTDLSPEEGREFLELLAHASGKSVPDVRVALGLASPKANGQFEELSSEDRLLSYIPRDGFLPDYMTYVSQTESPDAYHLFAGLVGIAASLQRHVFIQKGLFRVWPGMAVIFVGPTGKVRKTSAGSLIVDLLRDAASANVLPNKITPERLLQKLGNPTGDSTGMLFSPELAVFLGRQRYLEGIVPLLTDLLDARDYVDTSTIGREDEVLRNVCLCWLGCSTADWLSTAIPSDAFGGGFMARIIFVVQEHSDKVFTFPEGPPRDLRSKLVRALDRLTTYHGEVVLSSDGREWFDVWYRKHRFTAPINEFFAGYHERKPDHVLRTAMVLEASRMPAKGICVTADSLYRAEGMLTWTERLLPQMFAKIATTAAGKDRAIVLDALKTHGGRAEHARLLASVSNTMSSKHFKEVVGTLIEERSIVARTTAWGRVYSLWKEKE